MVHLLHSIWRSLNNSFKSVEWVFLDNSSFLDSIPRSLLLQTHHFFGCPPYLLAWPVDVSQLDFWLSTGTLLLQRAVHVSFLCSTYVNIIHVILHLSPSRRVLLALTTLLSFVVPHFSESSLLGTWDAEFSDLSWFSTIISCFETAASIFSKPKP